MVDWSIFWNNIFPGLVLILTSSACAYFLVHRYQRKKYNKEIRDDLIRQEHEILNKFNDWSNILYDLILPVPKILEEVRKVFDETIIKFDSEIKSREKYYEEKSKVQEESLRIKGLGEQLDEFINNVKRLYILNEEIILDVNLLHKRLFAQIRKKAKELEFINDFIDNLQECSLSVIKYVEGEEDVEKEKIKEERENLADFFPKVEEIILKSKIKFR